MDVTINDLKQKHVDNKDKVDDGFSLRTYRAISWLAKANELAQSEESDLAFVTLWIGFNALYADELPLSQSRGISDKSSFKDFIRKIGKYDTHERLYDLIWNRYPQSIRTLLNNQYAFTPFWQYQNGSFSQKAWEEDFDKDKKQALKYLSNKNNTDRLLTIVFDRLYTIRNQIVHGGATYASSVNRKQVKDAVNILGDFLPLITDIMMNHPEQDWGKPFYPPVDEASFE
ncbi:HEPN domain-containing protein [Psychrobacter celer]|uniref:HEPN domain-containing protein n=1 Tax=Psychrobacter celer TaxID=306572 RepID=UPI0018DF2D1B|nr:HEPN domain-containing protein [Psychrobacter celer]